MRAAVLNKPGSIELCEIDKPVPVEGELLIKIKRLAEGKGIKYVLVQ